MVLALVFFPNCLQLSALVTTGDRLGGPLIWSTGVIVPSDASSMVAYQNSSRVQALRLWFCTKHAEARWLFAISNRKCSFSNVWDFDLFLILKGSG